MNDTQAYTEFANQSQKLPADSRQSDVIVIGAGISGVTYAHHAARKGQKVTLLEKSSAPGGAILTKKFTDDFFVENGAHTFYSSYATILEMIRKLGLYGDIRRQVKKGYKMLVNGKVRSLFSQMSILGIWLGMFRMGGNKTGKTVEEFYTAAFGAKNYQKLIHPVTSAVICQDSAQFAAELLLKSRPKDKDKSLKSFSMKGGLTDFIANVAETEGVSLSLSTQVLSVKKDGSTWLVNTDKGIFAARRLVLATDATEAAKLAENISHKLSDQLKKLPMTQSTAFSVATKRSNMLFKPFGYLISTSFGCRSVVSRDVLPDEEYRGFTIHFKSLDFEAELPAIYDVLGIRDRAALETFTHSFTLPRLEVGHAEWLSELKDVLAGIDDFDLLGNFFGGLALEDCAIRAKAAAGAR